VTHRRNATPCTSTSSIATRTTVEASTRSRPLRATQAWSPLGGITFYRDGSHGSTLDDPVIGDIAGAHGKSSAQVMLRWGLQQGRSAFRSRPNRAASPRTSTVFDFELSAHEMAAIDGLDTGRRGGPEPEAITLEAVGREIPEA